MEGQTLWQFLFSTGQATAFFWIFFFGAGFTLVFFLFGEIFDGVEDVVHDALDAIHVDQFFHLDADGGPSVLSPRVISVFITIFGASGFVASTYKLGAISSSLIGIVCGFIIAGLFYKIYSWIHRQQSTTTLNNSSLVGATGIVKTEIPTDGMGEVIVDYVGSRITRTAKSVDGRLIPYNANVVVKEVSGQSLIVQTRS